MPLNERVHPIFGTLLAPACPVVLPHDPTQNGWYAISNAVRVFKSEAAARKFVAKDTTGTLVVRDSTYCR